METFLLEWHNTGDMKEERIWHTALVLNGGKVLVTSGSGSAKYVYVFL